ncbi:unnamed protein product [Clavelina lepadiformis]|uniref:Uncharacterized protein n=1 Tax=Clavelina lepadiformis TaxID=159417 RepID=A0ABP0G6H6_CLALP
MMRIVFSVCWLFLVLKVARSAEKQQNVCCRRLPYMRNIGYDLSGRPLQLDVGLCSASCGHSEGMQSNNYVSVLRRIKEKKDQYSNTKCNLRHSKNEAKCDPSLIHVETVTFDRGPKLYDVIDECTCRKVPKRCERVQMLKRFFVGTEFEATVDVGKCIGGCKKAKSGKACRPTRTTPQPITGPNGMFSVESISECRCEPTCYRQHFNVAVTEKTRTDDGATKLATKVIDVGRCVGVCGPIEHCVVKSNKRGGNKCLMSLETHDVTCSPTRVNNVTYTNRNGKEERVAQIRRCGCT